MTPPAWLLAALAAAALIGGALILLWRGATLTRREHRDLPEDWPLAQRPLFTLSEREMHHRLRLALPAYLVLAKVPLVRFCQPLDRKETDYWYRLLGPLHVSFVVCTEHGRVVAAVDVERHDQDISPRVATIKQAVLATCRIRYLKCREDHLASTAELQLLAPPQPDSRPLGGARRPNGLRDSRATLAHAMRARRADRQAQWYESGFRLDSFFAQDDFSDPLHDAGTVDIRLMPAPVMPPMEELLDPETLRPDPGHDPAWQRPQSSRPRGESAHERSGSHRPPGGRAGFSFDEQHQAWRRH